MRRLARRWLLNALTALSLLLCVMTVVLWNRATTAGDKWFMQHVVPGKSLGVTYVQVTRRQLAVESSWRPQPAGSPGELAWQMESAGWRVVHSRTSKDIFCPGLRGLGRAGFAWHHSQTKFTDGTAATYDGLVIPLWVIVALTVAPGMLIAAAWSVRRRIRRRRRFSGRCENCAYELTGNVSGACPECGNKVAKGVA